MHRFHSTALHRFTGAVGIEVFFKRLYGSYAILCVVHHRYCKAMIYANVFTYIAIQNMQYRLKSLRRDHRPPFSSPIWTIGANTGQIRRLRVSTVPAIKLPDQRTNSQRQVYPEIHNQPPQTQHLQYARRAASQLH